MAKTKARILKPLMFRCTKLANINKPPMMVRKNKVGPISPNTKLNEILLLRDGSSLSLDRRDDEYLQARRAVLRSYHLVSQGHGLKQKMRSLKGLCRDVGTAVHSRVGIGVYRFTVGCPWNAGGKILVFKFFLPHLKSQKKPCMDCIL